MVLFAEDEHWDNVREGGLNPYYSDMANIGEHHSWIHAEEPEDATQKAKDTIWLSVAGACHVNMQVKENAG